MPWYSPGSTLTIQNSQDKMPISIRHSINSSYHSDSPSEYRSCYPSYRRTINFLDSSSYSSSRSPPTSTYRSNSISDEPLSSSSSRDRSETRESSTYGSYTLNRQSRDLSKSRSTSKSSDSVLKSSPVLSSTWKSYSGTSPSYTNFYDELQKYSPSTYITGSTRSSYTSKLEGRPPRSYTTNARLQPTSISSSPTWEKSSLTSPSLPSSKIHQEVTDANKNNLLDLSNEDSISSRASVAETYRKFDDFQHSGENDCSTEEVSTSKGDSETTETTDKEVADVQNNISIKVTIVEEGEANGKSQEHECMANNLATDIPQENADIQNASLNKFTTQSPLQTEKLTLNKYSSHSPLQNEKLVNGSPSSIKIRNIQSQTQENKGLIGLKNIGNTCFLNSVVQCLSNTRLLMEYITSQQYLTDIRVDSKGSLMKAFGELIQNLWQSTSSTALNTGSFKSQVQRYAPRFDGYLQHDAQEFLRYLLEGLHEDINRVATKPKTVLPDISDDLSDNQKAQESWKRYLRTDNSKIVDIFVGQLKSTLQCTFCKHCSTTFEAFWDLSLSLPKTSGKMFLSQCLDLFTSEETLDGDEMPTCSKCKCRRKCKKRFLIHKFPQVLVLHLKRFSPSERYRKISVAVDFPVNGLDMSPYAAQSHTKAEYNLYAVANHNGTASSGHYTAYCKHPHSGQWHQYNDGWVTSQSASDLVSASAYVLFYEQISSTRL